ncbi:hypothetical protein QQG55_53010 [Brugia pahangi]
MKTNDKLGEIVVKLYDEDDTQQVDEFLIVPITACIIIIGVLVTSVIIFRILLFISNRKQQMKKGKMEMEAKEQEEYLAIPKTETISAVNSRKIP